MHNKTKQGFTLAELMAVVIIVALLAALSAGYYRRSVEQARFSEGLMAASAVAEAVNRACLERQMNGQTCSGTDWLPTINHLDISFPGSTSCSVSSCSTEYFLLTYSTSGVTQAARRDGMYALAGGNGYYIQIQPHFADRTVRDQIACVVPNKNDTGVTFCEAMGYTSCSEGGVCTKPN